MYTYIYPFNHCNMWYVLNFTGTICFSLSSIILITNAIFMHKISGYAWPPCVALICLMRVTFQEPGCVRTRASVESTVSEEQKVVLDKCAPSKHLYVVQPEHCHWSSALRSVVVDYDHYCTWCNNGIGLLNIRYFIQFLAWTFVSCTNTLIHVFYHIIQCQMQTRRSCGWLYFNQNIISPQLAFTIIFILFTGSMLYGQIENMKLGLNSVDRAKGRTKGYKNAFHRFFGSYTWLGCILPTPNSLVLIEHGKKSIKECSEALKDVGIKTKY